MPIIAGVAFAVFLPPSLPIDIIAITSGIDGLTYSYEAGPAATPTEAEEQMKTSTANGAFVEFLHFISEMGVIESHVERL